MRTDYAEHDATYRKLRAEGKRGWSDEPTFSEQEASLNWALRASGTPEKGRLLELGCGAGNLGRRLAQKGFEVHGVDISPTAVAWAREEAARENVDARFETGNVLDLSVFVDRHFDLIVDGRCLHCIIGPDRALALASIRRVLKPGGLLFLRTMCGDPAGEDLRKQFDPASRCLMWKDLATRYLGLPEALVQEVRRAGFEILDQRVEPPAGDGQPMLALAARRT